VPGKLPVSYVLTGNLLTGKLPATNITSNLQTLTDTHLIAFISRTNSSYNVAYQMAPISVALKVTAAA